MVRTGRITQLTSVDTIELRNTECTTTGIVLGVFTIRCPRWWARVFLWSTLGEGIPRGKTQGVRFGIRVDRHGRRSVEHFGDGRFRRGLYGPLVGLVVVVIYRHVLATPFGGRKVVYG